MNQQMKESKTKQNIGAVILAGGASRRMGCDKAMLRLEGKTFLERIALQLDDFDEMLLSVDDAEHYTDCQLPMVVDQFPERGPIGGLYSALRTCRSDWLFVISCDVPLFKRDLAEYLTSFVTDDYDAYVIATRDGWLQPLCAVYSKWAADILEAQIGSGNHSLIDALTQMRTKVIPLRHTAYPDEMVRNINTPGQYADLRRQIHEPPVIAVSGVKNSGKTTLLEGIVPLLRNWGLKVAVIKHDGHDFDPDVQGTDSYRLRKAGAYGVAVYSDHRYMLTSKQPYTGLKGIIKQFRNVDLILVEGGKHTAFPKLEVVRSAISEVPVCALDTLLALCTDMDIQLLDIPTVRIDDYKAIVHILLDYLRKEDHKTDQLKTIRFS